MRAAVPTVLTLAGLTLAACTAPTGANSTPSSPPATPSASASPSSSAVAFTFPKRTKDELARSEYRNGAVSEQAWRKVTAAGTYVVRAACAGAADDVFGYEVRVNGRRVSSGEFDCAQNLRNTVGKVSVGDRIDIGLTKVVAPFEAWAIVVPDPVG
jgi:hypothetical protein